MNIYEFINSKAIRNHLKEINYEFTSMEAAYIVWHSKQHSQKEKFLAWEWILKNMDNHEVDFWGIDIFTLMNQCMKIDKKLSDRNISRFSHSDVKRVLSEEEQDIYFMFDYMGINIPAPFVKGDIVSTKDGTPLILMQKSGGERNMNKFECDEVETWNDMIYRGYIFDKGEEAIKYVCAEDGESFLSLDYYRGQLKGKEKILKLLSNYYKNQFDPSILINTYISLNSENVNDEYNWKWIHVIDEEELKKSDLFEVFPICKRESRNLPF